MSIGKKIDTDLFKKIKVCKTTENEIIQLFGNPRNTGFQSGFKTLNWLYAAIGEHQNIIVFINKENVVTDYAINPVGLLLINDKCKK